jgi:HlyD family secretion protein
MKKKLIYIIIGVCVVVAGIVIFKMFSSKTRQVVVKTEKTGRATISNTVTATGTLQATVTVEVGTQVSGRIDKLYADYNSIVKKGQLIAQLDTQSLASTLESSKASLDQAQAEYNYQKANYGRYSKLIDKKLIAQTDFEEVNFNYRAAIASLKSAQATYEKNKTNLDYAFIYSPIDGIVLERDVEEGETVAASYSTPTLFTIANDLTQMEIEADVDEADIGQVKVGQRVEFTVDAFPDKTFNGEVKEIYLNPAEDESVVTYTVIVNAPNPEKILMPGMTANAVFYVTEKKNILVVSSGALSFNPEESVIQVYQGNYPEAKISRSPSKGEKTVWVKEGLNISEKIIKVGETDEINYELLSGVKENTEVVVSMDTTGKTIKKENGTAKSPFMPTPPGNRNKKK